MMPRVNRLTFTCLAPRSTWQWGGAVVDIIDFHCEPRHSSFPYGHVMITLSYSVVASKPLGFR